MIVLMPSDPLFESVDTAYGYLNYYLNAHVHFHGSFPSPGHERAVLEGRAREEVGRALGMVWHAQKGSGGKDLPVDNLGPFLEFVSEMDIQMGVQVELSEDEREAISDSFVMIDEDMGEDDDGGDKGVAVLQ